VYGFLKDSEVNGLSTPPFVRPCGLDLPVFRKKQTQRQLAFARTVAEL